ncbi:MAG: PDZ domain-containing protein [Nitrospinaceae bacterium]|nr:S41 family peptidase [Nitrospinaceae bacterium]NIR56421.1 S41 family peptidase [Nitrospinaceae bacterium]NIS86885.1 S41 family peptidase [Nitrospinaceae bacterium]NIT83721.1 S41 family peptidase [Nitrospinaceae bacterium]NIU45922.1 S41 family peptidase [Nitrospinaceae bacterium]
MNPRSFKKYLLGVLLVLLGFFLVQPAGLQTSNLFQTRPAYAGFFNDDLDVFDEVLELIADNYVYPPDFRKLFAVAIGEMVQPYKEHGLTVASVNSGQTLSVKGRQFSYRLTYSQKDNMEILRGMFDFLSRELGDKVNKRDMEENAIRGMLDSLDPYSVYLDPGEFERSMRDTEGQYGGVGMVITLQDLKLTVVRVLRNSPSARAGILPNDIITRVNGEEIKGMQIQELASRLRGYPNTQVEIDVFRPSTKVTHTMKLTREIISIETVLYKYLGDRTAYIGISSFSKQTNDQLEKALDQARRDGAEALILDLRDNPGGLLSQSVKVASHFLQEGQLIVYTQGRDPKDTQTYEAVFDDPWRHKPLAVLINSHSASASEIVAGSLKDSGKALILGENSYGKGSVQTIFRISDGSGLRLTTSKYYTPSGIDITTYGIVPEIQIQMDVSGLPEVPNPGRHKNRRANHPLGKPIMVKESELQNFLKKKGKTVNGETDLLVDFAQMAINNPPQTNKSHALAKARELAANIHHY